MKQHRQIREHDRILDPVHDRYQLRLLHHAYQYAPFYGNVMPMIERIMKKKQRTECCRISPNVIDENP